MSLIDYYPGDSFVHKLDPRTKVFALLVVTISIFIVSNFFVIAAFFTICIALWYIAGLPVKKIKGFLKFLISLFAFLTLMQALFLPGEHYLLNPIIPQSVPLIGGLGHISLDGIIYGLLLSFRLLTLVCFMPLVTMTTEINTLSLGLVKMGMSYKIAYMATTAINIIPTFQDETQVIMDAQKMRGLRVFEQGKMIDKFKAYPALVVPLVIGAMRRAQLMGVAMDARAFGASKTKTFINDIKLRPVDSIALVIVLVFCGIALTANFLL
jgi:energy-coupling factor transport system permease protein